MTRIVIFAKAPLPGRAKTRLIPALGAEGAASLARKMLFETVARAGDAGLGPPELCTDPPPGDIAWEGHVPPGPLRLAAQGEGDLGQRLARAARRTIEGGEAVLLVGADCPALGTRHLGAAARALEDHDAVIHPAADGGYVLLGLKRFASSPFENIGWSGPHVARDTIARIAALGWRTHVGEMLRDIDEPEDLAFR
ncbi:MAG: TIGR04282 family arsenosugar biosynthesis glycosyltransferase [Sphingomonadaceae bacterium]